MLKPLLVVCNKVDVTPMDQLSEASREALSIFEKNNVPLLSMSAVTDEGVMEVKQQVILILFILFLIFYVYYFGFVGRHVILS